MAEEDLIYGKNRHLFGGIEPSNMIAFNGSVQNGVIKITATLPEDTIIDRQLLCSVGGAIIRRKDSGYPKDEFDGDLVADIKASTVLSDASASATGTYYYAAFPYSAQGVYNRSKANRMVINEPEPMKVFAARSVYDRASDSMTVEITAELPDNVAGAMIRKSTTDYPETESDGTLFQNITSDGTYTDTNVETGQIYYYSAFPYTSTGVYNRSDKNRAYADPQKRGYLFGYDLKNDTANPSTRVIYPSDVDNSAFTPAHMDFNSNTFNYGDWNFKPGEKFMPRPCMLNYAGQVDHYLDPDNYEKRVDGTPSKVADTTFGGNAMMEWPKIYTKRWEENGVYHFRCSDTPQDDTWDCWCNYDRFNNKIDHFYTSIYFASRNYQVLRSISGNSNSIDCTAEEEVRFAKANGDDWYTDILADRLLIQDLLVMMGKSTDCQTIFGKGVCPTLGEAGITPGTMNAKGLFWGSETPANGVKVFGMENFWGNLWRRVAGWINDNNSVKLKITRGNHDGSTGDYNLDGSGYVGVSAAMSGNSGGYIQGMKTFVWGRIPNFIYGSSSTYEADGAWFDTSKVGYACTGGSRQQSLTVGPFCADLRNLATTKSNYIGTGISCKPVAAK